MPKDERACRQDLFGMRDVWRHWDNCSPAFCHHRQSPRRKFNRPKVPVGQKVRHLDISLVRRHFDENSLLDASRSFKRRRESQGEIAEHFYFHWFIVRVVSSLFDLRCVPKSVPAIISPDIATGQAQLFGNFGKLVFAPDKAEANEPRTDIGSCDQFHNSVAHFVAVLPTSIRHFLNSHTVTPSLSQILGFELCRNSTSCVTRRLTNQSDHRAGQNLNWSSSGNAGIWAQVVLWVL